jgi:hypothetical protein
LSTPSPPDHCHIRSHAAGASANQLGLEPEALNLEGKLNWDCSLVKVHSAVATGSLPKMPLHEPYDWPPAE